MDGHEITRIRSVIIPLVILSFLACTANLYGQMSQIAISPDGAAIAVTYQKANARFIYKISLETHNAVRLTAAANGKESSPAFSADGQLVAYSYVPEKQSQRIIVMNRDGSNPHHVAESNTANLYATFAPNGKSIYFARSQPPPLDHAWDLYSVETDGSNVQRLTHGLFYQVSQPSLSPDAKSLAVITTGADAHRQIAIYSLQSFEKPTRSLQPHVPNEASHDPIIDYPVYMPDGKSILFMAASDGKRGLDYDIYRVNLATGGLERLTNGNGIASGLKVSADGKMALFLKWHKNWRGTLDASELYVLDLQSLKLALFKIEGLK